MGVVDAQNMIGPHLYKLIRSPNINQISIFKNTISSTHDTPTEMKATVHVDIKALKHQNIV